MPFGEWGGGGGGGGRQTKEWKNNEPTEAMAMKVEERLANALQRNSVDAGIEWPPMHMSTEIKGSKFSPVPPQNHQVALWSSQKRHRHKICKCALCQAASQATWIRILYPGKGGGDPLPGEGGWGSFTRGRGVGILYLLALWVFVQLATNLGSRTNHYHVMSEDQFDWLILQGHQWTFYHVTSEDQFDWLIL